VFAPSKIPSQGSLDSLFAFRFDPARQHEAIDYLRTNRVQDVLFFRAPAGQNYVSIYSKDGAESYKADLVDSSELNIL
jgi:hypothetical protein